MGEPVAPISLYDILSNPLILLLICPSLPLHSILALTATSKAISSLLLGTPQVFRRLDLSTAPPKISGFEHEFGAELAASQNRTEEVFNRT